MPSQVATAGRGAERLDLGRAFEEYPLVSLGLVGLQVLPTFPVQKKAANFSAITRAGLLRTRDVRRQDKSAFGRGGYDVDELSYACQGYGWEVPVGKAEREVYKSDFDADANAQKVVQHVLDWERERRIAAAIFNDTTWTGAALYTDVTTDWDNIAATIIADIEAAKEKVRMNCGLEPNTLVVSSAHLKSFKLNTGIIAQFPGIDLLTDRILHSSLAAIFGVQKVLIGNAIYNTGGEGDAFAAGYVWADTFAWLGVTVDGGDLSQPGVGRTMQWDAFGAEGFEWDLYTEKQTKTDVWQGEHWVHEKVFDEYFGHLLKIDT